MGLVYKARQHALHRTVALKMVISGANASPAERRRFRTEAEAVARLQHPNIVQIFEVGEQAGCPYLALRVCRRRQPGPADCRQAHAAAPPPSSFSTWPTPFSTPTSRAFCTAI